MQKNKIPSKIMAINPGWRYLGIVIFDESGLREWRLKSVLGKGVKRKIEKVKEILADFIERYNPKVLAIKKLHSSRSSANLKIMEAGIKANCRKKGMVVFSYSIKEVEKIISPEAGINKKELAELLASEYVPLLYELKREQRSKNSYFLRLFEAVALGHACLQEKNNK